jgi:aspartyl-tRNA(Asn)/glutamyl-tRNA(Gln) amidotransferase subunit A
LKGHVPTQDATAVAKLAAAGTVLLGKLATHEFAFGGPSFDLFAPPARNPWNRDHFTSGSSSGSAAAIVAGLCYGTLGSDTGGSIRGPCALTGLAGIKPTYGLVSRAGVFPLSWTLDHVGPMTATIEDSAIMLEAIAGPDSRDPTAAARAPVPYRCRLDRPMSGLRIGVLRRFHARDVETSAEMASALDTAMDVLRGLGAQVTDVEPPPLAEYHDACVVILMAEAWAYHQRNLRTRWADHGRVLRQRVAIGAMIETPHYLRAQQHRRRLLDQTLALFDQVDLLVCPGATREAPTLAEARPFTSLEAPSFTTPFNLTGLPVASAVCGFGPKGLPLGLQFAAAPFEDATALAVAHAYERAAGWWRRRPEL